VSERREGAAHRAQLITFVVLTVALALAGAVWGHSVVQARHQGGSAAHGATPTALAAATAAPSAGPTTGPAPAEPNPAAVAHALDAALADPALGGRVLVDVVDAQTGDVLDGREPTAAAAPASTAKLLTAAALLSVRAPTTRLTTRVVAGSGSTIVLVGGGDPTITSAAAGQPGAYADAARLSDLAAQVKAAHRQVAQIVVDDGLFTGPTISPGWGPGDAPSEFAAPITAVMADGGRAAPDDTIRSGQPDIAAGQALASLLGVPGIPVTLGSATAGAKVLARVQSPQLSELVAQMLQPSDNVIAECLARQVAIARHQPASFTGAAGAIRTVLSGLGVDVGSGMTDGSGLAAGDRLTPTALAGVLRLVVGTANPSLRAIVTALPVAGWSGTLTDRFVPGTDSARGAGVVRAKTGTLTGVSALAGLVHDADGRQLVFAMIADQVAPSGAGTVDAEAALDVVASTLARCGCR
jgi:D-alanyl-D-alanine carboxypeptidase/D-alanyl-D-alanine-endopeptidase (penicillin-binding protein 4)